MKKFSKKKCGCFVFLLFFAYSFWVFFYFEDIGENIATKDSCSINYFLPDQAINISFYRNSRYVYYECDVSLKDALDFTSKRKWTMQPIGEKPMEARCRFFSTTDGPQRTAAMKYFEKYGESGKVYSYYISEGYYFDDFSHEGGYRIVYDTSLGKLFFQLSMR
jgi:hypothetical protein